MLDNLINFLKSMVGKTDKSEVEIDLQTSLSSLEGVAGSYKIAATIEDVSGLSTKESQQLSKIFYSVIDRAKMNHRFNNRDNFIHDISELIENVVQNGATINSLLMDIDQKDIVGQAMKNRDVVVFRAVAHYYFISKYAYSLLNYVVAVETANSNRVPVNIPKRSVDELYDNLRLFSKLLTIYGDSPKTFRAKIIDLPPTIITVNEEGRIADFKDVASQDIAQGLPLGFLGSPIYSIRTAISNWQVNRYRALKAEKPLLELRLQHWQTLKETGQNDAAVEEEIAYLQDKLNTFNRKISDMEESVQ